MTLTFKLETDGVKMNQHARYLHQKNTYFISCCPDKHTLDWRLYLDH